jgi:hypothetical protein
VHHLRPGALPIAARHALRQAVISGDWAGAESAPVICSAVKTVSTKAATPVETTAVETTVVEAAEAAMEAAMEAAVKAAVEAAEPAMAAATACRHNVGCKHSKCCSRQQRDCDFTEHNQPSLVQ